MHGTLVRRLLEEGTGNFASAILFPTFVEARFGDRMHCELAAEESANGLAIPALLLQPLVENAVRHGALADMAEAS
jgi:hypothetical protein